LSHTVIQFNADINHRVRTFGGYLWKLEKTRKKNDEANQSGLPALEAKFLILALALLWKKQGRVR
jgi:hypothetical protein